MITKERLEELIKQGAIIFGKYREYILRNREEKGDDFWWKRQVEIVNNELHYIYEDSDYYENDDLYIDLKDLYETKEDAEFVAKYHTSRVERFEPPVKLCLNESYDFVSKKGARMSIWQNFSKKWWLCYCGTHKEFDTYEEAVERARKLFLGCNDEN